MPFSDFSAFSIGQTIDLRGGMTASIVGMLGEGGQGIVYEVSVAGKPYALKWYTQTFPNKARFIENLVHNIEQGAPDKRFLWPLYFAEEQNGSFGYVMDLRPSGYSEFTDILTCKVIPSLEIRILAALNVVRAFGSLHRKGFSYQDLNDGNFFINAQNGDVLICDNDNVSPANITNPGGIGGKPGYMAPEVVTGESTPNTLTDYYSLAVILFKLFVMHDPLMGAAYHQVDIFGPEEQMKLYGTNPVFIFDPQNQSNRPVPEIDKPAVQLWPVYPQFFQETFIKTFAAGMKNPNVRVPENLWSLTLMQLRDEYSICPQCRDRLGPWCRESKITCPGCGQTYHQPIRLHLGPYHIPLFTKQKLYAPHTSDTLDDYGKVTGEVVTAKHDANQLGIRNFSEDVWSFINPKGEKKLVKNMEVIPVLIASEIAFRGDKKGIIENGKAMLTSPFCLMVKHYQIPLSADQQLFACHTGPTDDAGTVTGKVVTNKQNPDKLGLKNLSGDIWEAVSPATGQKAVIGPDSVIPLNEKDMKTGIIINFKGLSGRIIRK